MRENNLLNRTFLFGVNCLKFSANLPQNIEYNVIRHQLSKCSTSVGANYEEAQGATSKNDFKHKIRIAYKEIREANYWLRIIQEMIDIPNEELTKLIQKSKEIKYIFSSILKNTHLD